MQYSGPISPGTGPQSKHARMLDGSRPAAGTPIKCGACGAGAGGSLYAAVKMARLAARPAVLAAPRTAYNQRMRNRLLAAAVLVAGAALAAGLGWLGVAMGWVTPGW
jgi:hypothetical protein